MHQAPPKWAFTAGAFAGLVLSCIPGPWNIQAWNPGMMISTSWTRFQCFILPAFALFDVFGFSEDVCRKDESVIVSAAKFFAIWTSGFMDSFGRTKSEGIRITSSGHCTLPVVTQNHTIDKHDDEHDSASDMSVSIADVGSAVFADCKPNPYSSTPSSCSSSSAIRRLSGSSVKPSVRLPMKTLVLLSLFVNVANCCGDNAYRCVDPDGSVDGDWAVTRSCMIRLGFSDDCWCSHRAEWYADPSGADINAFKNCCRSFPNFGWREC